MNKQTYSFGMMLRLRGMEFLAMSDPSRASAVMPLKK